MAFKDHDKVAVNGDISKYGLKDGEVGTIVYVYENAVAYEVEFPLDVHTMRPDEIRELPKQETP